ncbi:BSD domain-containing protein, variant [Loa loa]|nr:BSD domain-containing protein, variant [Loa loa]EJD75251.1 BSD domain-containing protein, variant [Loa loa]
MNNITSWMQQAKQVTKKISDMMYIPSEDNVEPEMTLGDVVSKDENVETETQEKGISLKEVENKENISSNNGLMVKFESGSDGKSNVEGSNRSKLETNGPTTVEAAKKYANSFFSLAMEATAKAAITAEETAKKLQNVVTEKTIIGSLDKEQAKFKDEVNANKLTACILPWSDLPDQWVAKKHILSLSLDARNFIRDPPSETNFDFAQMQSLAAALLEDDPNLRKIRFQLVPKKLNEERFWRNYFYRVSLVRQAALGENCPLVAELPVSSRAIELDESVKSSGLEGKKAQEEVEMKKGDDFLKTSLKKRGETGNEDSEAKNKKLDEVRENIACATQERVEEDLERDLINSLNDYELVSGQIDKTDEQWEEEITELLNSA